MIEIKNVSKAFLSGDPPQPDHLFADLTMSIAKGRFVALTGTSGCGKTTLLNMIGGLDEPDRGTIEVAGTQVTGMSASKRARFLNRTIGFVFQFHYLLPELSSIENVLLPQQIGGGSKRMGRERAKELLEKFDLGEKLNAYPSKMSRRVSARGDRTSNDEGAPTHTGRRTDREPQYRVQERGDGRAREAQDGFRHHCRARFDETRLLDERRAKNEIDEIIDVKKLNPEKSKIARQGAAA